MVGCLVSTGGLLAAQLKRVTSGVRQLSGASRCTSVVTLIHSRYLFSTADRWSR